MIKKGAISVLRHLSQSPEGSSPGLHISILQPVDLESELRVAILVAIPRSPAWVSTNPRSYAIFLLLLWYEAASYRIRQADLGK